jgi:hypothetical protein
MGLAEIFPDLFSESPSDTNSEIFLLRVSSVLLSEYSSPLENGGQHVVGSHLSELGSVLLRRWRGALMLSDLCYRSD